MKSLIGQGKLKPFECVGTTKESRIAFYLSLKHCRNQISAKGVVKQRLYCPPRGRLPLLLKYFEEKTLKTYLLKKL